jgi:hypothetical protein
MTKVTDVIHLMHPTYKPILEEMMAREGMNGETTVSQIYAYFTPDKVKTSDERIAIGALGGAVSKFGANKFGAKLDLTRQCEIIALYKLGYNVELLSKAYGINRKTVTHMYSPLSVKYKVPKQQLKEMGEDSFIKTYATEEVINRVDKLRPQIQGGNTRMADGKKGIHLVQNKNCTFRHRVEIRWREADSFAETSGWYYKDMDGDFPEAWLRGDDESLKNSQACYNNMMKSIEDPL